MTKLKDQERANPRVPLQCDLSKFLNFGDKHQQLACVGRDASYGGMGVVAFVELTEGTDVVFKTSEKEVSFNVIGCKRDPARKEIYHIELKTKAKGTNVLKFLQEQEEGLIDGSVQIESSNDAAQLGRGDDPFDIDYSTIQGIIVNLHTSDRNVLRNSFLEKLADTHKAFAISYKQVSLIIVIPNGLRPSEAATLEEQEAAKKILIIKKTTNPMGVVHWVKVWPLQKDD